MAVVASLKFQQGATISPVNEALEVTTTGGAVTLSNRDNSNVTNWKYEFLDISTVGTTALTEGVKQDSATPTYSFTPDANGGCILVKLTVTDSVSGASASHTLALVIRNPENTFAIPPFGAKSTNINFGGQTDGWAALTKQHLAFVQRFSDDQDLSAGTQNTIWVAKANGYFEQRKLTISQLGDVASAARGDVFYYNGTSIVRLGAGTSGQFLKTLGTGADPAWADVTVVNGTTFGAGGSLTVGQVLRVTGAGAVDYGALDLADADAVTGVLPVANLPDAAVGSKGIVQLAGDFGGTAADPLALKINGTSVPATPTVGQVLTATSGTAATWQTPAASGSYTEYWVPDPTMWTDTAVVPPACQGAVFRVGATLYMFGGNTNTSSSVARTDNIYSAPYDASGTTPVFTDTGANMPGTCFGGRIALIGSTLYMFGERGNGETYIWTAPLATPTVWTDTGLTFGGGVLRYSTGVMVGNGYIVVPKGYNGSAGLDTCRYTSTSTPTSGWTNTVGGGITGWGGAGWEVGCAFTEGTFKVIGGFGFSTTVLRINGADFLGRCNSATALPSAAEKDPAVFDLGHELIITGHNVGKTVFSCANGRELGAWYSFGDVQPANLSYTYGANWIGGDGRIYLVQNSSRLIYRSGRQKVYVPTSEVAARTDPYQPLRGVYANGGAAVVSRHVLMGNAPWLTDKVVAY